MFFDGQQSFVDVYVCACVRACVCPTRFVHKVAKTVVCEHSSCHQSCAQGRASPAHSCSASTIIILGKRPKCFMKLAIAGTSYEPCVCACIFLASKSGIPHFCRAEPVLWRKWFSLETCPQTFACKTYGLSVDDPTW